MFNVIIRILYSMCASLRDISLRKKREEGFFLGFLLEQLSHSPGRKPRTEMGAWSIRRKQLSLAAQDLEKFRRLDVRKPSQRDACAPGRKGRLGCASDRGHTKSKMIGSVQQAARMAPRLRAGRVPAEINRYPT